MPEHIRVEVADRILTIALDRRIIWSRGSNGDAKEDVAAFLEKRAAVYPDKVSSDLAHFSPWLDDLEW